MNVYNGQNEKIGDIKELMLDKSGKIANVVIGVGGFLGAGEHDVAVKFDELKWSNGTATTGTAASEPKIPVRTYPDHAVLNATKDQLKSMPNFDYTKQRFLRNGKGPAHAGPFSCCSEIRVNQQLGCHMGLKLTGQAFRAHVYNLVQVNW